MTAGPTLCWAIAAFFFATASGRTLRSAGGQSTDDGGEGSSLSMLTTGSEMQQRSSQLAGAGNPLSWLFGGAAVDPAPLAFSAVAQPQMPMGLAQSVPVAAVPPAAGVLPLAAVTPVAAVLPVAGSISPTLGLMPVSPSPMAMAGPPPGTIPLAALSMTPAPSPPVTPQPAAANEVAQLRSQIADLRNEVVSGNRDMWGAVKLISATVEKDEATMQALTQDVQTLRGRHGGSVPLVATECSMRQSSCSECLSVPTCVWCKVEQRCYSGDSAGPVRGECAFFRHGTCG